MGFFCDTNWLCEVFPKKQIHIFLDALVWNFVILMREAVTVGRPVRRVPHLAVQEKCMCTNTRMCFM